MALLTSSRASGRSSATRSSRTASTTASAPKGLASSTSPGGSPSQARRPVGRTVVRVTPGGNLQARARAARTSAARGSRPRTCHGRRDRAPRRRPRRNRPPSPLARRSPAASPSSLPGAVTSSAPSSAPARGHRRTSPVTTSPSRPIRQPRPSLPPSARPPRASPAPPRALPGIDEHLCALANQLSVVHEEPFGTLVLPLFNSLRGRGPPWRGNSSRQRSAPLQLEGPLKRSPRAPFCLALVRGACTTEGGQGRTLRDSTLGIGSVVEPRPFLFAARAADAASVGRKSGAQAERAEAAPGPALPSGLNIRLESTRKRE